MGYRRRGGSILAALSRALGPVALILLLLLSIAGCGNSSFNQVVTGDAIAEDLTGTSSLEIRLDPSPESSARDIRRLRFLAYNAQGNLVYGPTEKKANEIVRLGELPRFSRTLEIEYLSGPDGIVTGRGQARLILEPSRFSPLSNPPFEAAPPGQIRIFPRAVALAPGETADLRAIEDLRDGMLDQSAKVIWTSSDPTRLRVSNAAGKRGQVTPVGEFRGGDVTITARLGSAQILALHSSRRQGQVSGTYYQGPLRSNLFGELPSEASLTCLDLDGDGIDEIAVASGARVRGVGLGGVERFRLEPFLPAPGSRLEVASADLDGDGQVDLVVGGIDARGTALVRGYDGASLGQSRPRQLFSIEDLSPNYSGGVHLAAAAASSGGAFVAVGAGPGRSPEVSVYALYSAPNETLMPHLSQRRLAFEATDRGGVRVALGDLDFDGQLDLVSAPGPGGAPLIVASSLGGQELWRSRLEGGPTSHGVSLASGQLYGGPEDDVVARVAYQKSGDQDQTVILDGTRGAVVHRLQPFGDGLVALTTGNVGLADLRKSSATVRLTSARLAGLELVPAMAQLSSEIPTVQLAARARYSDGTVLDASDLVSLTLSPDSGDALSLRPRGLVTGLNSGSATVLASYRGETAQSTISVFDPPLPRTISIVPVDGSAREETEVRFQALGSLEGGRVIDLTERVTWGSENEGVVSFDRLRRGLGQVRGQGKAVVMANDKLSGVTARMVFHGVSRTPPDGLRADPDLVKLTGPSQSRNLTVNARYPEGLEIPIREGVSWSSSHPDLKVSPLGKVSVASTARESTSATVTATVASLGQSATAKVVLELPSQKLQALYLSPSRPVLEPDQTLPLVVEGRFGEGSSGQIQTVTSGLTFSSSNPEIIEVSANGSLRASSMAGSSTITVSHESGVRTQEVAEVKLPLPVLRAILVTLDPPSVADGESSRARAIGKYETGPDQDLTNSVVWSSSSPEVARVSSTGGIETLRSGQTAISAVDMASGTSGQTSFLVREPRLLSLTVSPGNPSTRVGSPLSLSAEGTYSNGEVKLVSPTWSSGSPAVFAFASAGGGAGSGLAAGVATVIATLDQVSATVSVTVNP